jgi:lipoprotein
VIYNQARCINDIDLLSWFYASVASGCEGNVKWAGILFSYNFWLYQFKFNSNNSILLLIVERIEFVDLILQPFNALAVKLTLITADRTYI